jgi:hypothetical protein
MFGPTGILIALIVLTAVLFPIRCSVAAGRDGSAGRSGWSHRFPAVLRGLARILAGHCGFANFATT